MKIGLICLLCTTMTLAACQPPAPSSAAITATPVATEDQIAINAKQTIAAALATPSETPIPAASATPTADSAATQTADAVRMAAGIAATLTALPTSTATATPTPSPTLTPDRAATATALAYEMATAVAATLTAQPTATTAATATPTTRPTNTATPTPTPIKAASRDVAPALQIAYVNGNVGDTDIYVYDWATGDRHAVANQVCDEAEPAWSPAGRHLLYQANCAGSYDIYRADVNLRTIERLTTMDDRDEREPDQSPDGALIVFRVSAKDAGRNNDGELWIMQANGANGRGLGIAGRAPVWSPDGRRLVFMSERRGGWEIYLYDFASGATTQLSDCAVNCRFPAWSPDGQAVIYHTTTRADNATAETIWYVSVNGGAPTQVVSGQSAGRASWSSGGLVVFNSDAGIEIVNANGGGRQVVISSSQNWAPAWSH